MAVLLGLGAAGGVGAIARFALDAAVGAGLGREFPYGTLIVNLLGSFVLGVLAGVALSEEAYRLLAIGLIGAFTTFSTWVFESHRLGEDGELRLGFANFVAGAILGIVVVWAGLHVGALL